MLLEFSLMSIFKITTFCIAFYESFHSTEVTILVVIVKVGKEGGGKERKKTPMRKFINPDFAKEAKHIIFNH